MVNAHSSLGTVELRLLLAMLARIEREDTEFREMHIPLQELVGLSGRRLSIKDYLVIGAFASRDWINTSHGRKIEKAVELRAKGTGLRILSEERWQQFVR